MQGSSGEAVLALPWLIATISWILKNMVNVLIGPLQGRAAGSEKPVCRGQSPLLVNSETVVVSTYPHPSTWEAWVQVRSLSQEMASVPCGILWQNIGNTPWTIPSQVEPSGVPLSLASFSGFLWHSVEVPLLSLLCSKAKVNTLNRSPVAHYQKEILKWPGHE